MRFRTLGRIRGPGAVTAAHGRIVFALVHADSLGIFNPAVQACAFDQEEEEEGESEHDAKKARTG